MVMIIINWVLVFTTINNTNTKMFFNMVNISYTEDWYDKRKYNTQYFRPLL